MAKKRTIKTVEQAAECRQLNRAQMANKRASEQADERRRITRACSAINRAVESSDKHKKRQKLQVSSKRSNSSMDAAIDAFLAKCRHGPDYVCVSCNRLMYRQTVVPLNKTKYVKVKKGFLDMVIGYDILYASFNSLYYICKTCDNALGRGRMPLLSVANNLKLSSVPPELSCLNRLETRLVCLRENGGPSMWKTEIYTWPCCKCTNKDRVCSNNITKTA